MRSYRLVRLAATVGAVLALVAPSAVLLAPRDTTASTQEVRLTSDAMPLESGTIVTALDGGTLLPITIVLAPRNVAGLEALIADPSRPSDTSPSLSEATFEARFAPTPADAAQVVRFLADHGGTNVTVTPDRLGVRATLTAGAIDQALGIELVRTVDPTAGTTRWTALGAPSVPRDLRGVVAGIDGLSGPAGIPLSHLIPAVGPTLRPAAGAAYVLDNATGEELFIGSDYTQAFGVTRLFPPSLDVSNATFPASAAVATLLLSGYNDSTGTDLGGYDPVAVDAYFNDTFPAAWPHPIVRGVPVTIGGTTPPAPGAPTALTDTTLDETENALDLEMAGSLAPGATVVNFYFGASLAFSRSNPVTNGALADDFAVALADALAYDYGPARLAAVTNSFGLSDLSDSLWTSELVHAAALGVTVVAASGDQGNAPDSLTGRGDGAGPVWPASAASDLAATIAVGGTTLVLSGGPSGWMNATDLNASYDAGPLAITSQSTWYDGGAPAGNLSGTEGGISAANPEPNWQFDSAAQPAIVNATLDQGAGALGRAEPDVAFPARATVVYADHDAAGVYYEIVDGTSIAAPVFAGWLASCAAVVGHGFGNLDPELYRIASYFAANPGNNDPFLDVTTGGNYVFQAAPGWDPVTGWGSLDAVRFLQADANGSIRDYNYTGPTPGLPPLFPLAFDGTIPILAFAILGIGLTVAVVAVLLVGRPRTPTAGRPPAYGYTYAPGIPPGPGVPPVPPGAYPPAYGLGPPRPATSVPAYFACPYCGRPRPAEPVRCPSCGAL